MNGIYDFDGDRQLCRDYINRTGLTLPYPKIATLVCARNVLCGEETTMPYNAGKIRKGEPVLKVETITKPVEGLSYATHPHLVHKATIIMDTPAPNGLRRINPFVEFGGRYTGIDVHVPVISSRPVYYHLRNLEKLPLGSPLPSVWNPA